MAIVNLLTRSQAIMLDRRLTFYHLKQMVKHGFIDQYVIVPGQGRNRYGPFKTLHHPKYLYSQENIEKALHDYWEGEWDALSGS